MSSTVGRLVVSTLTNKSGGSVAYGDVVIMDSANDTAFTTTTTGAYTGGIGVCIEPNGIASNASGRIQTAGLCAQVNCNASVTRGYFLQTHTAVKQAAGNSTRQAGSFGVTLTTSATPQAVLFGFPDGSTGAGGLVFAANRQQDISTLPWWAINSALATVNAANRAAFYPIIPLKTVTVTTFNVYIGTSSGNLDFGIYDSSLTKLKSVGSTASPGTATRTFAISAGGSQVLTAGALYYIATWADNTTLKFAGYVPTQAIASGMTASTSLGVCAYLNAAGTSLPAGPVTPSGYDLAFVPYISLT